MSDATRDDMLSNLVKYLTKVKTRLKPIVYAQVNIAANASITYDLTTVLTGHAAYDLRSCRVNVLVLNTEDGAATKDMFINSTMSVVHGINAAGKVVITNYDNKAITALVTIDYPSVKK